MKEKGIMNSALILFFGATSLSSAAIQNCLYEDTIDITGSKRLDDGSYTYKRLVIPAELTGTYDYELLHNGDRKEVAQHLRACICKLESCIKLCCPHGEILNTETGGCVMPDVGAFIYDPHITIYQKNEQNLIDSRRSGYVKQVGMPCTGMYALEPNKYPEDKYKLFDNGTLLRLYDQKYLSKLDYCLSLHRSNVTDGFVFAPMNCLLEVKMPLKEKIIFGAMLTSVPFFLFTIGFFLLQRHSLLTSEKSLICYLAFLAVGYSMMATISLVSFEDSPKLCQSLGFLTYYMLLAAFFWLSTLSFEMWRTYRHTNNAKPQGSLASYALYACLCPFMLTLLAMLVQQSDLAETLKPGIGHQCWLKTNDWSAMLYLYGPISAVVIFNAVMYILTVFNIHRHGSHANNLRVYFVLIIVMGLSWSLEIASYLVGTSSDFAFLFFFSDFFNALQGILIFITVFTEYEQLVGQKVNFSRI